MDDYSGIFLIIILPAVIAATLFWGARRLHNNPKVVATKGHKAVMMIFWFVAIPLLALFGFWMLPYFFWFS